MTAKTVAHIDGVDLRRAVEADLGSIMDLETQTLAQWSQQAWADEVRQHFVAVASTDLARIHRLLPSRAASDGCAGKAADAEVGWTPSEHRQRSHHI